MTRCCTLVQPHEDSSVTLLARMGNWPAGHTKAVGIVYRLVTAVDRQNHEVYDESHYWLQWCQIFSCAGKHYSCAAWQC